MGPQQRRCGSMSQNRQLSMELISVPDRVYQVLLIT
jgi:hypothetical protein